MSESTPNIDRRTMAQKVREAIAHWETKGPTSLTVALMAEALYAVRASDATHGLNHAPLPKGVHLDPGYCSGCDAGRTA